MRAKRHRRLPQIPGWKSLFVAQVSSICLTHDAARTTHDEHIPGRPLALVDYNAERRHGCQAHAQAHSATCQSQLTRLAKAQYAASV